MSSLTLSEKTTSLARDLVRIRSYTGEEQALADFVANYLDSNGVSTTIDANGNILATAGNPHDPPALLLNGHLDTVPVADAASWTHDPFAGVISNGRLYGRGACDMKGGLAALMVALCEHAPMAVNGIVFTAVTCEEATESDVRARGIPFLIEEGACKHVDFALIAEPTNCRLSTGHPGRAILKLAVGGLSSHAAMPGYGVNAVSHLVQMLNRIRVGIDAATTPRSVNLSMGPVNGGVAANVVPDSAEILLDTRFEDHASFQELLGIIRSSCDGHVAENPLEVRRGLSYDIDQVGWREPVTLDDKADRAFARFLLEALGLLECELVQNRFCTDASFIRPLLGIPVLLMGPGDETLAHQRDEFVEVEQLGRCAEAYLRILAAFSKRDRKPSSKRRPN